MNFDLKAYKKGQRKAKFRQMTLLTCLCLFLSFIWWGENLHIPSKDSMRLWNRVREAELHIGQWRKSRGSLFTDQSDPWNLGLIGLEWSPLSTTLGSLQSKRTACDPAWSLVCLRWFEELGLEQGDPVVIYSSSSFPGMLINVLAAAESRGLAVHLMVSLGSSTWGCNDPVSLWPDMASELRGAGFLHTRAFAYSYGGNGEVGGGLSQEALSMMNSSAERAGVPLIRASSKKDVISWKMDQIERIKPKLVISIGGSSANMGDDEAILKVSPGLLRPSVYAGDGVIGRALKEGYPVIHLLNLKSLSWSEGIPYDSKPSMVSSSRRSILSIIFALALYLAILFFYRPFEHSRLFGKGQ